MESYFEVIPTIILGVKELDFKSLEQGMAIVKISVISICI